MKGVEIDFKPEGTITNKKNDFYIYGEIDNSLFEKIIIPFKEEVKEQLKNATPKINIYINSPGGDMYVGQELMVLMEDAKDKGVEINTYVLSWAASMATLIFIVGTNRYVGPGAKMLIHYPSTGSYTESVAQLDNNSKEYKYITKRGIEQYKKYCNIDDLEDKLAEGNHMIFGGKNLIKQGLADFII